MRLRPAYLLALCAVAGGCGGSATHDALRPVGAEAVDVSTARGPQSEAALALSPVDASELLAGSNDLAARAMRVYGSRDGGVHWSSRLLPKPTASRRCETSDPGVAFAPDGSAYYSFLGIHCSSGATTRVYVARRSAGGRAWSRPLPIRTATGATLVDDRPSIVVDAGRHSPHRGRIYVAWTRFSFGGFDWVDPDAAPVPLVNVAAVVSYSGDGRRWSRPVLLSSVGDPLEARLAVSDDGTVYATWRSAKTNAIFVSSSHGGGRFTPPKLVAASVVHPEQSCHTFRARIPAQPKRCVSPNPVVAVDVSPGRRQGRVYVVWGSTGLSQSQDVYVAAFDPQLKPLLGVGRVRQVNPEEPIGGTDEFLPTASVSAATGRLWACYYRSVGAPKRRARFTCQASDDGAETWTPLVAATAVASDETKTPADLPNGYGDYESVAATPAGAVAIWTDGRRLRRRGEEIYARRIGIDTGGRP